MGLGKGMRCDMSDILVVVEIKYFQNLMTLSKSLSVIRIF